MSDHQAKPGVYRMDGKDFMIDAKGSYIPVSMIKEHRLLEDGLVRELVEKAEELAVLIRAFKERGFAEVDSFNQILDEKYGVSVRGEKGNQSLSTFDGLMQVQVAVADLIEFGPELQQAKNLIDGFLKELTKESSDKLITIVTKAFNVDKEGKVNAKALLALKSYNITDDPWVRAMQAIDDSIRITGSKRYFRVSRRSRPNDKWSMIALNIAVA